jgi:predicted nucleotidyltransferase
MKKKDSQNNQRDFWIKKINDFLPHFLELHPILKKFYNKASILLHGSITMNFDNQFSDIDLWFLIHEDVLKELEDISETRFFEIEVNGKIGHLNAESIEEFSRRFHQFRNHKNQISMDLAYQLRNAEVLIDNAGVGIELIQLARNPMRKDISDAFFFYHYVEMRGDHRSSDNPMNRHDPVGVLLSLPKILAHALKAAMVLHGEPYPYDKWLCYAASKTPTGKLLIPSIKKICDFLAEDMLRFKGSELENPISKELKIIRQNLIKSANAKGNYSPWLEKWWLYMTQAVDAVINMYW